MTDKAISDNTEVTSVGDNDFFVVELSGGNTRKIKKSNVGVAGRQTPSIVQSASIRGDTTITLGSALTTGNLLVLVTAGYAVSLPSYVGAGFALVAAYTSNTNNGVRVWVKPIVAGTANSYALSASDNQQAVLYEVANCSGVKELHGGAMSSYFSGTSFTLPILPSPFGKNDLRIFAFEHDTANIWTVTAETGLTTTYSTPSDGNNHTGAMGYVTSAHDNTINGSVATSVTQPVFGIFALIGKPA